MIVATEFGKYFQLDFHRLIGQKGKWRVECLKEKESKSIVKFVLSKTECPKIGSDAANVGNIKEILFLLRPGLSMVRVFILKLFQYFVHVLVTMVS